MNKKQKLFFKAKDNPKGLRFSDLLQLARYAGFQERKSKGGHHQYKRGDNPKELMTFQPAKKDHKMAMPYQVKNLIRFIEDNNIDLS